jgi:type IV pilus assembly protein PilA
MNKKGFTLIELLIVIAIIAILAVIVFVALNPLARFQAARDSTRWSNVTSVLDSIKLNQIDNGGSYIAAITALTAGDNYQIGTAATGCDTGCTAVTTEAACADLTGLVTSGHLSSVPMDPVDGAATETLYYITKATTGVITIGACTPEGGAPISVSR